MDNLNCYAGSGCTVNITGGGADICWNLGGSISGNTTCNVKDVGFCQNINQTAYTSLAHQAGYNNVACKTSRGTKSAVRWGLLALCLLLGAANATITLDECTAKALQFLDAGDVNSTYSICGTGLTLNAVNVHDTNVTDSAAIEKRIPCVSSIYTQTQVVQTGLWWDVWAPEHDCVYCGLSNEPCTLNLGWSDSESVSYSAGFNIGTGDAVTKVINASPSLNFGFSWTSTKTNSGSLTCTASPQENVQIWVQNQKGWSNSQTREVSTSSCSGPSFGPWSAYQHADWPLNGNGDKHLGCSTGAASGCN